MDDLEMMKVLIHGFDMELGPDVVETVTVADTQ